MTRIFFIVLVTLFFLTEFSESYEIFHTDTRQKVESFEFLKSLSQYDVILLGEYHNQKSHHDFRGFLVEKLEGEKKAVGFEHIQQKDQKILEEFKEKRMKEAYLYVDELAEKLKWEQSWGNWLIFRLLFEKTYKSQAEVFGLNLSSEKMKQIVRKGKEALELDFIKKTGLDKELPKEYGLRLKKDIERGHCHKLTPSQVKSFYFAQRARDAFMTEQTLSYLKEEKLVFVMAGNNHVRKDYGMPWYFHQRGYKKIVSVKLDFLTKEGQPYWDKEEEGGFDYVVFFDFKEQKDPCNSF